MIDSNIPTYNGGCGFNSYVHIDYKDCPGDDKFRVMKMQMNAGIGTHMDAPSHCFPDGAHVHDFEIQDLCMPCNVIDVSLKADERYSVTVKDILAFEADYGRIIKNSCVMIKTGWAAWWGNPEKYRNNLIFPSMSPDAAKLLLDRGVIALGIDTLSADRPDDGFKVHQLFLGSGKILVENVAYLDKMPAVGSFVMIVPIKVKDITEAPVRVIGLIP